MPRGRPKKSTGDPLSAKAAKVEKPKGNGANLGFEARLFLAANKLGKNLAGRVPLKGGKRPEMTAELFVRAHWTCA